MNNVQTTSANTAPAENAEAETNQITTVSELDKMLDSRNETSGETKVSETNAVPNTAQTEETAEANNDNEQAEQETPEVDKLPKSKQNSAFAEMRIQNRQQQQVLKAILQRAGLDVSLANDPNKLMELLEDASVTEQAEQLKVPPEILKRLNYLENVTREAETEKIYTAATQGFQLVKDKYNLTDEQLVQFATQLKEDGINPFEQPVNLVNEYVTRNLDDIIKNAQEQAVQAALAQQNKAVQYSSTPSKTQGAATSPQLDQKINTQAAFNNFLASLKK